MRIDRRLVLIAVMLIVLSMTMATQYATTRVSYSFAIVHPSDSDIRYIGSDNSSDDTKRVLRVNNNGTGTQYATLELGDWMPDSKKSYTAAFGIVNEEPFYVNITHVNITGTNNTYLSMWFHGDRDQDVSLLGDSAANRVKVLANGSQIYSSSDTVWTFTPGDQDPGTMCADTYNYVGAGCTQLVTAWDDTSKIKYSTNDANNSINGSSDFVWVQVVVDVPPDAATQAATGKIYIHFKAATTDS